jgi:hypothetical protein
MTGKNCPILRQLTDSHDISHLENICYPIRDGREASALKGQFQPVLGRLKQPVQKGRFATVGRQAISEMLVFIGLVVR